MPTPDTALVYPGMCLLEGTNVSEGRGTCRPFEIFGAPWLDSHALVDRLAHESLPGVKFRPASFTPTFDKFKGESCRGAMIHVTDPDAFRPVLTGIAITRTCRELGGERFLWRKDAYEFVREVPAFDLLCGTDAIRKGIEGGVPLAELVRDFEADCSRFELQRRAYRLYD
jgi:uncharacterized protein YbbC (DUF1343 family)